MLTNSEEIKNESTSSSIEAINNDISNFRMLVTNDHIKGGSSISGDEFSKLINENIDKWKYNKHGVSLRKVRYKEVDEIIPIT